jgi:hypothetical protein
MEALLAHDDPNGLRRAFRISLEFELRSFGYTSTDRGTHTRYDRCGLKNTNDVRVPLAEN